MAKNLSELSTEELKQKQKTLKNIMIVVSSVFSIVVIVMLAMMLSGNWSSYDNPTTYTMPVFAMMVGIFPSYISKKKIDEELKKREE